MKEMLGALIAVLIIAAVEIWRVLRDIRSALEEAVLWAKDISQGLEAVVNELDRIGGILGGILADMPSHSPPPEESQPVSNYPSAWDRLRATTEEKKLKVVDRRACAAERSRNAPSDEAK